MTRLFPQVEIVHREVYVDVVLDQISLFRGFRRQRLEENKMNCHRLHVRSFSCRPGQRSRGKTLEGWGEKGYGLALGVVWGFILLTC